MRWEIVAGGIALFMFAITAQFLYGRYEYRSDPFPYLGDLRRCIPWMFSCPIFCAIGFRHSTTRTERGVALIILALWLAYPGTWAAASFIEDYVTEGFRYSHLAPAAP
jgi:hypothetical protein